MLACDAMFCFLLSPSRGVRGRTRYFGVERVVRLLMDIAARSGCLSGLYSIRGLRGILGVLEIDWTSAVVL